MIGTLKKTFTRTQETKPSFTVNFSDPAHQWITENPRIERFFNDILELLSEEEKDSLVTYGELIFLESQGMHSSVISIAWRQDLCPRLPAIKKGHLSGR